MEIVFLQQAIGDLEYWKKSGNKPIQKKIQQLLQSIASNPTTGIGKPEQLQHELSGL